MIPTCCLYKVTCRGMTNTACGTQAAHGIAYVVARNPDEAYKKLRKYLDEKDLGFRKERDLDKVELVAEAIDYPSSIMLLT